MFAILLFAGVWVYEARFVTFDQLVTYVPVAFTQDEFRSDEPIEFVAFANAPETVLLNISDQFLCLDDADRWARISYFPEKTVVVDQHDPVLHPANIIDIQRKLYKMSPEKLAAYTVDLALARDWPVISYKLDYHNITRDTTCKVVVTLSSNTPIFNYTKVKALVSEEVRVKLVK
jgi:hypothetical protein